MTTFFRRFTLLLGLLLLGLPVALAQQPVFRIGVLDDENGSIYQAALLAVEEINNAGGVRGADGTLFRLELVRQGSDAFSFSNAIANINQASVIAVLGPERSQDAVGNLAALQQLGVPILTPATDDALIVLDNSGLIIRTRAAEALQGRALANYLITDVGARNIATVQMDIESTASVVGFTTALSALGTPPRQAFLLDNNNAIETITQSILRQNFDAVAAYGAPELVSQLYNALRGSDWDGVFAYNRANTPEFRQAVQQSQLTGVLSTSTWSYADPSDKAEEFVTAYIRAFGSLPNEIAAATYDAVNMIAQAIGRPGALLDNLRTIRDFEGVQGILNPAGLARGETSSNVIVTKLGRFGAPQLTARFQGNQRLPVAAATSARPTATPAPTATPEGVYVVITRNVQNVRTGPGTEYDVLGQLQRGETAQVIGANLPFTWVVINFRGQQGWLSRDILDLFGDRNTVPVVAAPPTPTPMPATATPTPPPTADIIIVSASPNRLTVGQPFNVSVLVQNIGSLNAGQFAVAASLNPGNVYTAQVLGSLGAGQQVLTNLTGTLGVGPTGPQSIPIIADLNNEVNEGPAGEANNNTFFYNYIADAPLLSGTPTGTVTIGNLGTFVLDGGTIDIQWSGGVLVPVGSTKLALMAGYTNIDQVHYDAIVASPLLNAPLAGIAPGQAIAIQTDGGNKYGVLFINNAVSGGNLTFTFRMYN